MPCLSFKSTLVDESEIIGIGPLMKTIISVGIPSVRLYFDLYCRSVIIPFTTDAWNDLQDSEKRAEDLNGFTEAYHTIYDRVKHLVACRDDKES